MLTDEQVMGILREVRYQTSRSGGKGGQNVNKVETRVELWFDPGASAVLSENEKAMIAARYAGGEIKVVASKHRSQLDNKKEAQDKLLKLLKSALTPVKKRKKTRPGKAAREKKLGDKKHQSEKKEMRQKLR